MSFFNVSPSLHKNSFTFKQAQTSAAAPLQSASLKLHFGCISSASIREMDSLIRHNPSAPMLENVNPNAWYSPPKDAQVMKAQTLLSTPEYDVRSIHLKTEFAKGMRPGQHLYVAPSKLTLGDLAAGYRRYSIAAINHAEDTIKLVYRQIKNGLVSNNVMAIAKPSSVLKVQGPDWNGFVLPPRSANMLAFATGIANIAPMHCLLKTRLKLQEGPLGQTRLYSTYQTPTHEVAKSKEKYGRLSDLPDANFLHHVTYSNIGAIKLEDVEAELRPLLHLSKGQDINKALADVMTLKAPLSRKEKARVLRMALQLGSNKEARAKSLDYFLDPKTYVYICGIIDVEQTARNTLQLMGHEAGKLKEVRQAMAKMQDPSEHRWRFEGVRMEEHKVS